MKILLVRNIYGDTYTKGVMWIDDEFECYTLEDIDRSLEAGGEKVYGKTAIPKGMYKVALTMSNRFKRVLPEILDVPGFTGIRIHTGNTSKDTDGCILVGETDGLTDADFVGSSKKAFEAMMIRLRDAAMTEEITIEVV